MRRGLAAVALGIGIVFLLARKAVRRHRARKEGPAFYDKMLDATTVEFLPQAGEGDEPPKGILSWFAFSHVKYAWYMNLPLTAGLFWLAAPLGAWVIAYAFGGWALWTFAEYAAHRWFLHALGSPSSILHRYHHQDPKDLEYVVVGPGTIATLFALLYLALRLALHGWAPASAVMAGFMVGYLLYETLHYAFHLKKKIDLPLLRDLQRLHLRHHNYTPDLLYGVTTTFWDWLFDTDHWPPPNRSMRELIAARRSSPQREGWFDSLLRRLGRYPPREGVVKPS